MSAAEGEQAGTDVQGGSAHNAGSGELYSPSFVGLLLTQFLTATNDNIFRWLVIGIGKQYVAPANIGYVLAGGTICFVAPYLLLAAPAGYFADRFSKRSVIVACKVAEIVIMALGVVAILIGSLWLLMCIVALMGAQSALFSPSKLGSIPEMLKARHISAANGLMGLSTVVAAVVGMGIGNVLTDHTGYRGQPGAWMSGLVLICVATVGWLLSLFIARLEPADPRRRFPFDALVQTVRDLRTLASSRPLLRVALGIVFFWSLGALAQLNIDQFGAEGGTWKQSQIVPLLAALATGVGVGSVLAGIWSRGRVELGILPLGAGGIALFAGLLFFVQGELVAPSAQLTASYVWACVFLFGLGTSAGLFDVPLAAFMQYRSPRESRGAILSAGNFLTFGGMLVMSVLFAGLRLPVAGGEPLFTARQIFLLCGICSVPVFLYIVWLIPQTSIRFAVWLASGTLYRIRVYGRDNLPDHGGAVLVANHPSWLDGFLVLLTSSRPVRLLAWAGNFQNPLLRRWGEFWGAIYVSTGPKSIRKALETAREALRRGELVCVFPEGGVGRTGQIQGFRPGVMRILEGIDVPVVPIYLDELWGSIFSFERGKFFWKWPRRWPYPISIHFGAPIREPHDLHQVRRAVQELGTIAVQQRTSRMLVPQRNFLRRCKDRLFSEKIADSTGASLTGGQLLARTLVLRRLLRRHVLAGDEQYVGLLLPPTAAGIVANAALALDRRIAVNLNYTTSSEVMNHCIRRSGIRHVLTSEKFLEKLKERQPIEIEAELVPLETLRDKVTVLDKLVAALSAYAVPSVVLERCLGLHRIDPDDVLTVIFTSGSTGEPKGAMLTHANVASNVDAMNQVVNLRRSDVLIGALPLFHSFGYTVATWSVLSIDVKGVYHFNPLDAKLIGKLCGKYKGTIFLATPTFLRSYLRRCAKEDFATLDILIAGAEKLPGDLSQAFEDKFGVRPVEGYGATELSPLVSVNVPPSRSRDNFQIDCKEGTVGRTVPGVTAKVLDLETGAELGADQPGMLWIKGPNVMKGYLGRPDLTADVIRDGWYMTGDVAKIDADGFITITGRESRFSKIGGEMVPHILIEDALSRIIGIDEDGAPKVAVTAVPHPTKGERLVVVHTALDRSPQQLCEALAEEGLPNLFIPSADSFCQVDALPVLGSGKLDLVGVKKIALDRFGVE